MEIKENPNFKVYSLERSNSFFEGLIKLKNYETYGWTTLHFELKSGNYNEELEELKQLQQKLITIHEMIRTKEVNLVIRYFLNDLEYELHDLKIKTWIKGLIRGDSKHYIIKDEKTIRAKEFINMAFAAKPKNQSEVLSKMHKIYIHIKRQIKDTKLKMFQKEIKEFQSK